jgi:hypothetical protein
MIRSRIALALPFLLFAGCRPSFDLPDWQMGRFKIAPYLQVAAELQGMGREAACQRLLEVARTHQEENQVIVLCRMLFQKRDPSEFRRPWIGAPSFFGGTDIKDWPLEPIEVIDGIPFLITRGYRLAGSPEPAESYLRMCMTECDWNPLPFTEPTPKRLKDALEKLTSSARWKRPLDGNEKEFLSAQIQ